MRNKAFHIHLHLDHPERENPWLEEPEPDLSAAPFLDDADRALHSCWGPLSEAERRAPDGSLRAFSDLYSVCGFDASPSVLETVARRAPKVYERIAAGARANALATAYPALALPAASEDDRRTAVRWGLADFERRFGTKARGFVPPAGAADDALLARLAREGLRYAVLPAAAASRVRHPEGWLEASPDTLDCSRPYRWRSASNPALTLAVYFTPPSPDPAAVFRRPAPAQHGAPPRPAAAPDEADAAGERLAAKLVDSLRVNDSAELAHAAFDASWFGLRAPRGERALARALDALETQAPADALSYEDFLDRVGAPQEAELRPGAAPPAEGWKAPLRATLVNLSASLAAEARTARAGLVRDPDAAVDLVGGLLFSPDAQAQQAYLDAVCRRHPRPPEALALLRLAELERWRLKSLSLWAYEALDPAAPDALQALRCAARALDLAVLCFGRPKSDSLEAAFVEALAAAPSRGTPFSNAAAVYKRLVQPERAGPERAAADAVAADHLSHEPAPAAPARPASAWEVRVEPLMRRPRREGRAWGTLSVARVSARHRRTYEAFAGTAAVFQRPSCELEVRLAPGGRALPGRPRRPGAPRPHGALRAPLPAAPGARPGRMGRRAQALGRRPARRRPPRRRPGAGRRGPGRRPVRRHAGGGDARRAPHPARGRPRRRPAPAALAAARPRLAGALGGARVGPPRPAPGRALRTSRRHGCSPVSSSSTTTKRPPSFSGSRTPSSAAWSGSSASRCSCATTPTARSST